jgi:GTP cyclohydrolase III
MNDKTTRTDKRKSELVQEVQAEMFSTVNYIIAAQQSLKFMFSTLHQVQMIDRGEKKFDGQLRFFN